MVSCTVLTRAKSEPVAFSLIRVDDGDTIHLRGDPQGIRLVGFNAPESTQLRAKCEAELRMGKIAKARLKQILERASMIDLQPVACACRPGTEGTNRCNFGRRCAYLAADSVDVGAILIKDGLAEIYRCGKTRCPPVPRPWCR
ncbi:MAG: thermonuclease family protein [Rhizobiales bacterium]|nr:thermonuclease family protein [Hyphomicrobiales bacterium]